ncbi:hypothetical protein F7725_000087, partial [Dissostichus mawsoni]
MTSLTLKGVTVNFPFVPYDCQKDYMSKVIECLQEANGVLESPTGTGKTLCLLCATLAWRERFKDTISARKITEKLKGEEMFSNTPLSSWGTAATDGDTPSPFVQSQSFHKIIEEHGQELVNSVLDVEDLVKFGNKQRVCPYYLSRSLKQQADIVFTPYNYLLDPKSRRAHNIELNGAVVIFDEAHNVEKTCEESTSFDLTPYDVASAITAVDRLLAEQAKEASHGDTVSDFNVESLNSGLKLELATIAKIKLSSVGLLPTVSVCSDRDTAGSGNRIDSYDVPNEVGITKPGISKTAVQDALEQITGYLAGQPGVFVNTSGLQQLTNIIQLVFCGEPSEKEKQQQMETNTAHFKVCVHSKICSHVLDMYTVMSALISVHIHRDTSHQKKNQSTDVWASSSSSSKKQGNILSYWCFSPGYSMQSLVDQGNSHVIERDQIFVSVIERGPDGEQLSSAFIPENMSSLGKTVAEWFLMAPGVLSILLCDGNNPGLLESTWEFRTSSHCYYIFVDLIANGHADRIETVKPMFVEPRGKGTFNEVMDGYYNKVNDPSSKGEAFSLCVEESCEPGIGRVIRHKDDYGAILLCDQRFKSSNARAQLPSWVRPYVRVYSSFGNVIRDLSQFFRVAQKLVLDAHLPSLKRRRLRESEDPPTCWMLWSGGTTTVGKTRANHLSTLSLQCDKRMDDEMRGGKRKIKLVQQQVEYISKASVSGAPFSMLHTTHHDLCWICRATKKSQVSEAITGEGTSSRVKGFLAEMKKSLSQCNFEQIVQTLQTYKKTDDLDVLLTDTAVLTEDANTTACSAFIRPHHKQRFDERCRELTGGGCSYEPSHSLSVEEKKALLNSEQLNKGGLHLSQRPHTGMTSLPLSAEFTRRVGVCSEFNTTLLSSSTAVRRHAVGVTPPPSTCSSAPKSEAHASFQADVKKAIGAEKTALLLQAIQSYKRSDCYEALVGTAKQYKEMLQALAGQSSSAEVPAVTEDEQRHGEEKPNLALESVFIFPTSQDPKQDFQFFLQQPKK